MIYGVWYIPSGAGFLPSTVVFFFRLNPLRSMGLIFTSIDPIKNQPVFAWRTCNVQIDTQMWFVRCMFSIACEAMSEPAPKYGYVGETMQHIWVLFHDQAPLRIIQLATKYVDSLDRSSIHFIEKSDRLSKYSDTYVGPTTGCTDPECFSIQHLHGIAQARFHVLRH